MGMDEYLYNSHDIPVIITIGECLLLTCILLLTRNVSGTGNGLLAVLVLTFGIQAFDTLIYWNENIKPCVASIGVWPFWVLKWIQLLQGPLVYAYVRKRISGHDIDYPKELVHLVVPLCGCALLAFAYWDMSEATRLEGVYKWGKWYREWPYEAVMWLLKFSALAYGFQAIKYLYYGSKALENRCSNPDFTQQLWLKVVVYGYLFPTFWVTSMGVLSFFGFNEITAPMGMAANYFNFIFVNAIVFFNLHQSHIIILPLDEKTVPEVEPAKCSDAISAENLKNTMLQQKLYLNPDLTLAQLADVCCIAERKASEIISQHLGNSFFQLVNSARIEHAKKLLLDTNLSVQNTYAKSGFNSKATFYRIFKRYGNMTPTEFREKR